MSSPWPSEYPDKSQQIKTKLREQRVEAEIARLHLEPIEIKPFRIVAEFLDCFRWGGELIDLRISRGS